MAECQNRRNLHLEVSSFYSDPHRFAGFRYILALCNKPSPSFVEYRARTGKVSLGLGCGIGHDWASVWHRFWHRFGQATNLKNLPSQAHLLISGASV